VTTEKSADLQEAKNEALPAEVTTEKSADLQEAKNEALPSEVTTEKSADLQEAENEALLAEVTTEKSADLQEAENEALPSEVTTEKSVELIPSKNEVLLAEETTNKSADSQEAERKALLRDPAIKESTDLLKAEKEVLLSEAKAERSYDYSEAEKEALSVGPATKVKSAIAAHDAKIADVELEDKICSNSRIDGPAKVEDDSYVADAEAMLATSGVGDKPNSADLKLSFDHDQPPKCRLPNDCKPLAFTDAAQVLSPDSGIDDAQELETFGREQEPNVSAGDVDATEIRSLKSTIVKSENAGNKAVRLKEYEIQADKSTDLAKTEQPGDARSEMISEDLSNSSHPPVAEFSNEEDLVVPAPSAAYDLSFLDNLDSAADIDPFQSRRTLCSSPVLNQSTNNLDTNASVTKARANVTNKSSRREVRSERPKPVRIAAGENLGVETVSELTGVAQGTSDHPQVSHHMSSERSMLK